MNLIKYKTFIIETIIKYRENLILGLKRIISKFYLLIIQYFTEKYKALNKTKIVTNPLKLEDFTPIILSKEDDKYADFIKFAIDNPNTKNIALTGPYGSGKSTILNTFKDNNKEYKYLNISLATFDEKKTNDIKEIEYCILKQLFYKVEHKKIPQSRFKRIVNQKRIWFKSLLFFGWLISAFFILKIKGIDCVIKEDFLKNLDWFVGTITFIFCIGLFGLTYKIMDFVLNFKLTKFKIGDAEAENNNDKKSVDFENEIDEILYFFERNLYTVVFLEDLDRYKNTEIFIKLREINFLLNNYEPIKENRKITFIYAVQDDTFKEDERAKFFDFIIPVIPLINYTNSSKSLKEKINWKEDEIDENFIKKVSRYLSDNRTIISIANEYKIYKKTLAKGLNNTNLLAMMIYKNVEPTDFDNLKKEKGFVYSALNNTEELITARVDEIDTKINKVLKPKIEAIKKEQLESVKELRSLYVLKFQEILELEVNDIFKNIYIGNKQYTIEELIEKEGFDEFIKQSNITIKYYQNQFGVTSKMSGISFSNIESQVGSKREYKQRLSIIEDKTNGKENQYNKEIEGLNAEKQKLNSKRLSEIATDSYFKERLESLTIDGDFIENTNTTRKIIEDGDLNENTNNPSKIIEYKTNNINLIKFLLENGYIDEKYYQYISFFYDGDITKTDNDFLLSFSNNSALPFDYRLNEIESILAELSPSDFERSQILNFDLLEFICYGRNQNELNLIVNFLDEVRGEYSMNFIFKYIEYEGEIKIRTNKGTFQPEYNLSTIKSFFMNALCKNWYTLWDYFVNNNIDNFSNDDKLKLLHYIFIYVDFEIIVKMDAQYSLSYFIAELESLDLLIVEGIDTNKIINFIEKQNVLFNQIDNMGNDKLFKYIYEKNHYELNPEMIALMVDKFNKNEIDINLLETENYTTILNTDLKNLKTYILDDLDTYIENIFLKLEHNIHESEQTIINLLKNENIEPKLKPLIIEKNVTLINDISIINDKSLWILLIQKDKLVVNWNNLLHYYKGIKEFDDVIVNYLNREEHYNVLKSKRIDITFDKTSGENIVGGFAIDLINCKISIVSFKELVLGNSLPYLYENIKTNFDNLSKEKMVIFIQKTIVVIFNIDNFNFIKEKFNDLLFDFIQPNILSFLKEIDKYKINNLTTYKLLAANNILPSQKLAIFKTIKDSVYIEDVDICIAVAKLLFENQKTKLDNIGILKSILKTINNIEHKVVLFNLYSSEIPNIELKDYIELLGKPYSEIIKGKQPDFPNNTYNKEFIKKNVGNFISKIKTENEKFITVTTKRKKL